MHKADWDNGHPRDLRRGYQSHHLFIPGSSLDRWQSKHCWSLDPADEWPLWNQSNHLQNMYIIQDIFPCPASFPTPVKEPNILSVIFHLGDREAHWSILELVMRWVPVFSCIEDTSRQHCGHLCWCFIFKIMVFKISTSQVQVPVSCHGILYLQLPQNWECSGVVGLSKQRTRTLLAALPLLTVSCVGSACTQLCSGNEVQPLCLSLHRQRIP